MSFPGEQKRKAAQTVRCWWVVILCCWWQSGHLAALAGPGNGTQPLWNKGTVTMYDTSRCVRKAVAKIIIWFICCSLVVLGNKFLHSSKVQYASRRRRYWWYLGSKHYTREDTFRHELRAHVPGEGISTDLPGGSAPTPPTHWPCRCPQALSP